jgi:exo-beta-1,3-glucanase (GH17 family)
MVEPRRSSVAGLAIHSVLVVAVVLSLNGCSSASQGTWEQKVDSIVWVAYSPTRANPDSGIEASPVSIREDLALLRKAGFTGLVTYSSGSQFGQQLPALAESTGFVGLIMGIWDPTSPEEKSAAQAAAKSKVVLGYCVGNEGLRHRYDMATLSAAIRGLQKTTNKPVTTAEELDDYPDEELLGLGDWVFPNVHPYFHRQLAPREAVEWTHGAYEDLTRRTKRFVMFKEVGLPTAGDTTGMLSEANQDEYYRELKKTGTRFVYFEAFDQPWKKNLPIEPHWGIFRSDRAPKMLATRLSRPDAVSPSSSRAPEMPTAPPVRADTTTAPSSERSFYVYRDADSPDNHYKPTGYMGDIGDIHIDEASEENPHSGTTCIRVVYDAEGKAPNKCPYDPPCRWAGVYWQEPPNNWGTDSLVKKGGFPLSQYRRLVFWARATRPCTIEFKVAGISGTYGDTQKYPRGVHAKLTNAWQQFAIDLNGAKLTRVVGGFEWDANWEMAPNGAVFYLDDIRFEER